MKAHEIWKKGWLRNKQYCWNTRHPLYNPLIDKIVKFLGKSQNVILIVVGTPRSGKSWFSIWLMCYMNFNYFRKLTTIKDIYWEVDEFLEATKDTSNREKFITMEEQGLAQYKKTAHFDKKVQGYDKVLQIFGVDETNIIVNLPYLFDLYSGTAKKGHLLFRSIKKSKKRVNIVTCEKRMTMTTEQAYYKPVDTWENVPSVYNIHDRELRKKFVDILENYEKMKLDFNIKKKLEITNEIKNKGKDITKKSFESKIVGRI